MCDRAAQDHSQFIHSLTGIRGYAALWVVFYHLRNVLLEAFPELSVYHSISAAGFLGVDLFSVLSGFVISFTYGERMAVPNLPQTTEYLWHRLVRIYPMVLFMLGVFTIAFLYTRGIDSIGVLPYDRSLMLQLFMLNGWGFETQFAWNVPSWTVSAEWFCYLCFPFAAPLLARITHPVWAVVITFFTIIMVLAILYTMSVKNFDMLLDWGVIRIGGEFLSGCLLYRCYRAGWASNLPWDAIGIISLLIITFLVSARVLFVPLVIFLFTVLIYSLSYNPRWLTMLFGNKISLYLGEISYSIYMVHWFVVIEIPKLLGDTIADIPAIHRLWLLPVATVLVSALTNYFVERQAKVHLRKLLTIAKTS